MSDTQRHELLKTLKHSDDSLSLSQEECAKLSDIFEHQSKEHAVEIKTLQQKLNSKAAQLEHAQTDIRNLRHSLNTLYGSTSWKLAAPLRLIKNKISRANASTKQQTDLDLDKRPNDETDKEQTTKTTARLDHDTASLYVPRDDIFAPEKPAASLYAFYLPQFHPIAQNNEWWGEGFTEWTNVRPAKPLYDGHYQPHEPDPKGGLGYYDLQQTSEVMGKQIELARQYGVEGFCFYFYWFAGERLLETPLLNLLDDPDLNVPFCLCWANENWSRRWDGRDDDILMAQNNTPQDDLDFIKYVSKYLKDPRYRRIDGKPLLIVYRPIELPNAKATAKRWRKWCRSNGVGEIYLAYTQSFENNDPREYGFDGAIEFPPNNSAPPDLTEHVTPHSNEYEGKVYDWDIFPTRSDNYAVADYPLFRTVCPAWDNTARRKQGGAVFENSTPARYQHWVSNALADTQARFKNPDNRLIFVNAWNEWAEGAHLEPDARYGHAYLAATRQALISHAAKTKKIVLVSHDALHHGAQILTLNLARELSESFGYEVDLIVLGEGPMMEDFAKVATVHNLSDETADSEVAKRLISQLSDNGANLAICNTTVTGPLARTLKAYGFQVISLIHELTSVIEQYSLQGAAKDVATCADKVVFPAKVVKDAFEDISGPLDGKAVICPQGAYKVNKFRHASDIKNARKTLRTNLNLRPTARILLGVGYADARKGFDLFLDVAEMLPKDKVDIVCVWLGHQEPWVAPELQDRMDALVKDGRLILPGRVDDTDMFYAGADVFLLTSREDPYPSTVLEALDVGLPIIGFEGVTGSVELIKDYGGYLVPTFDVTALKDAALKALITTGDKARKNIYTRFRARPDISFRGYAHDLLALAGQGLASDTAQVSVVVPNYNYAHYLESRINSITSQSYPIREIVILDDGSVDNSVPIINKICAEADVPTRFIPNDSNSGSVFIQWLKGVEAARGEFVWIAEADDLALPHFLKTAMSGFKNENVIMSYTQSSQMSEAGGILDETYLSYVSDIDSQQWTQNYLRNARVEIAEGLSVKNSIPNVSAVIFRREPLLKALTDHLAHIKSYRVAGDWAAYVHLLASCPEDCKIAYHAAPLNLHRRHDSSVTNARFGHEELDEIRRMQNFIAQNVDVPTDYKVKADRYLNVLREQFGLSVLDAAQ